LRFKQSFETVVSDDWVATVAAAAMPAESAIIETNDTRSALIEAAAEVFAEVGFHHARVRDICQRAGANVAAVNYHFGDKERLYSEVMRESFTRVTAAYPLDMGVEPGASAEDRLRAFVRSYFLRIFACDGDSRHSRMILREMVEPTAALDQLIQHVVHPTSLVLDNILKELLGPGVPEPTVRMCGMSVIGQALFYIHCQPVIRRAFPDVRIGKTEIDRLAEHVTTFSLAGIYAIRDAAKKPKRKAG
jgi:TetR/AcrR family transcriptional regulator, regulator of cefoperazone and chloramphenicol sensitivity